MSYSLDSDEDEQDQHDLDIEVVPPENLDPDLAPILNFWPRTKWAKNIIEAAGDGVGNPEDRRRTSCQYQNDHISLSHVDSLSTEWCNKLPGKCYLMIVNDQPFGPQKNKIDHYIPPLERRNTYIIHHIRRTLRGSHE